MNRFNDYINELTGVIKRMDTKAVYSLALALKKAWKEKRQVFLCGNGGSAANALHITNDLLYGIAKKGRAGIRAHALPANQAVLTCLANDVSYEEIFSGQLPRLGASGDILIALSGSGNSMNIVNALKKAKQMKMNTFAILGYSGGKCLKLADTAIHFPINDMQIAEDMQLVAGHMVMQWLRANPPGRHDACTHISIGRAVDLRK